MQWVRDYQPNLENRRMYRRALLITLVGNILLAAGKGIVAYLTDSVALYADAANSVTDVFYSIVMVIGLWIAQQPPDLSHPQGHSRFEPLVGLLIAAALTIAGYEAAKTAVERFLTGGLAVEPGLPTLVLLGSAALKAGMYVIIKRIAESLASPTLATAARDNLSDVLTSVAAFVGVLGSGFIHPLLDPVAGLLVSLWIFRAAWDAWRENLDYLTGAGAGEELRAKIVEIACAVPGVLRVHQVVTEYAGPKLVVDLHINVDGYATLYEAHAISDAVHDRLQELPEIDRVYVHVEPHDVT
ncbi:MAG: cation transporter [Anaerolineae bacterium]|nr:cation transporter [Anaerolineae bacterium]